MSVLNRTCSEELYIAFDRSIYDPDHSADLELLVHEPRSGINIY